MVSYEEEGRAEMGNKGIRALLSIVVILGLLSGSFACAASKPTATPAPAAALKPMPAPTPEPVPLPNSPSIIADGQLSFVEQRSLTFGISGRVSQVNVRVMDRVTKGQVLAKLDTTDMERAVKTAEIAVKAAEIAVNSAEGARTQAENDVKSTEAGLKQAEGNLKSAQIDLEQATDDFRKITYPYSYHTVAFDVPTALGFISDASRLISEAAEGLQAGLTADKYNAVSSQLQEALDSLTSSRELLRRGYGTDVFGSGSLPMKDFWTLRAAQLQMDKAQLAVESAQNVVNKTALAIDNARVALDRAQLAVDNASNNVDSAKNDLDRARDELDRAVITAPFDGVIARVNVKEGDFLPAGYASTTVIEMIDPSRMELSINVDELAILNIKPGQQVTIILDALPDKLFEGMIMSISPLPMPMAGSSGVAYEVKAVFDVPENLALKAGMRGWADIAM
jgi:HlyD family secretion protein